MAFVPGLLFEVVFGGSGTEGGDVGGDESAVVLRSLFGVALEGESEFDMAAEKFLFEQSADAHLERFQTGGHAELWVEEAVIHAFQAERKAQAVGDLAGDSGRSRSWSR